MLFETFRLVISAIMRNAMRSFLTVLGVVIGVATVISMVTVGQGSTAQVQADVASLGSNLLMVRPGQSSMGAGSTASSVASLTLKDVEAIKTEISGVIAVAPNSSRMMTAIVANQSHATLVVGTDNAYLAARGLEFEIGRDFYESGLRSGAAACILGPTPRKELFGSGNPVGAALRFGQTSCRVIGVLASRGASSFGTDQDDLILMPIRAFNRRIAGKQDVGMIYVSVSDSVSPLAAKSALERLMRDRRKVATNEEYVF